jgi:hypothetical protein
MTDEELLRTIHEMAPRLRLRNPATLLEVSTMSNVRAELIDRFGPFDYVAGEQAQAICHKGFAVDCGLAPGHEGECVSRRRLER